MPEASSVLVFALSLNFEYSSSESLHLAALSTIIHNYYTVEPCWGCGKVRGEAVFCNHTIKLQFFSGSLFLGGDLHKCFFGGMELYLFIFFFLLR